MINNMNLFSSPSLVFDTTILEDGTIKIPELIEWQNKNIHIVIVFNDTIQKPLKQKRSLAGKLKKYSNPSLLENETDLAWSKLKDN